MWHLEGARPRLERDERGSDLLGREIELRAIRYRDTGLDGAAWILSRSEWINKSRFPHCRG